MKKSINILFKISAVLFNLFLLFATKGALAQSTMPVADNAFPAWLSSSDFWFIAGLLVVLLLVVVVLAKTNIGLSQVVSKIGKKSSATILLLLVTASAFGQMPAVQEEVRKTPPQFPAWAENPNVYIMGLVFVILVVTILVLFKVNKTLMKIIAPETYEKEEALALIPAAERPPGFLRRLYTRLTDTVPVAREKDILLDHNYDGIQELDNNLPPWWKYGFYATIIFAFIYLFNYHIAKTGKLQGDEYKEELAVAEHQRQERIKAGTDINEENVAALTDGDALSEGKATFIKFCAPCHRPDAGGLVGPNLTDEYWLHGGGIKNVFKTITYGVPNKGMLTWKTQLSPKQIQQVASYVLSLKGTNPPGPKEPQGDKWVEESKPTTDTASTAKHETKVVASAELSKK